MVPFSKVEIQPPSVVASSEVGKPSSPAGPPESRYASAISPWTTNARPSRSRTIIACSNSVTDPPSTSVAGPVGRPGPESGPPSPDHRSATGAGRATGSPSVPVTGAVLVVVAGAVVTGGAGAATAPATVSAATARASRGMAGVLSLF